jgi:hypothetical protein
MMLGPDKEYTDWAWGEQCKAYFLGREKDIVEDFVW